MKRRRFFEQLGLGSVAAVVSAPVLGGNPGRAEDAEEVHPQDHDGHDPRPLTGNDANATVSFGEWQSKDEGADPPQNTELDRYPNNSPGNRNSHDLLPFQATVREGGAVNFIIAGLHQVIVYAPGKKPEDVKTDPVHLRPTTGVPAGVPLINDPDGRVYAGLDPSLQPRDRVEVVQFPEPGLHLVICGVLGHFQGGMLGYVRVLPRGRSD